MARYISLRRHENMTLQQAVKGIRTSELPFLQKRNASEAHPAHESNSRTPNIRWLATSVSAPNSPEQAIGKLGSSPIVLDLAAYAILYKAGRQTYAVATLVGH